MTERIDEKDLALVPAAPADELRAVRAGKSVRVPIGSLPASAAVQAQIDALAAGQAAGQLVYRTWAELSGVTGSAGVGAQVISDAGTHTDPVVGGTVANAGQYVWSASPAGWRWVRPDALAMKVDRSEVADLPDVRAQALVASYALRSGAYAALTAAQATSLFDVSNGYARWARAFDVGTDLTAGAAVDGITLRLMVGGDAETVQAKLWSRDVDDTAASGAGPGQAGDVLLQTVVVPVADLGLIVGAGVAQEVTIPLHRFTAQSGRTYLVEIDALDAANARVASGVMWATTSGQSQRRRGYFYASTGASTWSNIGTTTTLAINLSEAVVEPLQVIEERIGNVALDIAQVDRALVPTWVTQAWRYGSAAFGISDGPYAVMMGFVGGVDVPEGTEFTALRIPMALASGADTIRVRLWSRPADASWKADAPGTPAAVRDTLHAEVIATPAMIGVVPGSATLADATFDLGRHTVESGRIYYVEVEATAAGARVRLAVRYLNIAGLSDDQYSRFWRSGAATAWSSGASTKTWVFAFDLVARGWELPEIAPVADRIVAASIALGSGAATVDLRVGRADAVRRVVGSVAIAVPTVGTVTDEALTLNPAGGAAITYSYLKDRTEHADLWDVVVKDASTSAVLVKGTDYWAIEELGAFSLAATTGTPRSVLVSYKYAKQRYDVVHYTPETGAMAVAAGTERDRDQAEFIPAVPDGALPLFHIHVRRGGNVVVPVWDVDEWVRREHWQEVQAERARSRRLLRPALKKLRKGDTFKLMSYGDSNFAQMGGGYSLAAVRSAANTVWHDRTKDTGGLLLAPAYGSDVLATIPTYNTGDGAGTVHTRFGLTWELVRALEAGYASTITYINRSIPGTNSTDSTYHGRDSVRLSAATGDAPDVVLIGFGQNELGQSYTRANIIAICEAFKGAGSIPIVVGCFRPHAADLHSQHTTPRWQYTQRQLREAAYAAGVPYVSTEYLYSPGEEGALGLSPYDLCAGTKDVHPGIREHRIIGQHLAALFE